MKVPHIGKEFLTDIIKQNTILVIIDNCKNVIAHDKKTFNKILKYLIENTYYLELLVVTKDKEDIFDHNMKV